MNHRETLKFCTGNWLHQHLDLFAIRHLQRVCGTALALKPAGELMLAHELSIRAGKDTFIDSFAEHMAQNWQALCEGNTLDDLIAQDTDLLPLLGVYRLFKKNNFHCLRLDERCRVIACDPFGAMHQWPACTQLDLLQSLRHMGFEVADEIDHVFSRSWLARRPADNDYSPSLAYYITHLIFCMTDYGANRSGLDALSICYLSNILPIWLITAIKCKNLDLAAELIIAMTCIGMGNDAGTFIEKLYTERLPDGALPGTKLDTEILLSLPLAPKSYLYFLENYHSTLVAFMATVILETFSKTA